MVSRLVEPLSVVYGVFRGTIKRNDLLRYKRRNRVYVAVAIMLAFPEHYFVEGYQLKGNLGATLWDIIAKGNPLVHDPKIPTSDFAEASHDNGLHRREGSGPSSVITMTPPPELVELVRAMGATRAAKRFQAQVVAAANASTRRGAEAAAKRAEEVVFIIDLIDDLRETRGNDFLVKLYEALHKELRQG